jgi:hypothetical protein
MSRIEELITIRFKGHLFDLEDHEYDLFAQLKNDKQRSLFLEDLSYA